MRVVIGLLGALGLCLASAAAGDITADFVMERDPRMDLPVRGTAFPRDCKPLWFEALARPEADFQRQAAEAIARAHTLGMPGLLEAKPKLAAIVTAEGTNRAARFAAAHALIVLEARDTAPALQTAAEREPELRQLIEPALAQWGFAPMVEVWRTRLSADDVRLGDLLLAIEGVGTAGDDRSVPALLKIVAETRRNESARLAAARAAVRIKSSGFEPAAESLATSGSATILDRYCAVALLARHEGEAAENLLVRLAQDSEPAVAAEAAARLNSLRPELAVPLAEAFLRSPDPKLRVQGIASFVLKPTAERVSAIAPFLDDPHPLVRRRACAGLAEMAGAAELSEPVRQETAKILGADDWRGQEQGALLLGTLEHQPAAPRLLELLESPRGEVAIASAWGLRRLALPETAPAIFDWAAQQTALRKIGRGGAGADRQAGHLFEALGLLKYAPAEPLLRGHIAHRGFGEFSRGAAIWALGLLHEGQPDQSLINSIVKRMVESPDDQVPEPDRIFFMCAATLVRIKAESAIPPLRELLDRVGRSSGLPVAVATRWMIRELTGEVLPGPDPRVHLENWFLEPLGETTSPSGRLGR
jgi:HEAT repeat protein